MNLGRALPVLVLSAAVLATLPAPSQADLNLDRLTCVKPLVAVHDEKLLEVNPARLQEALLAKVRARLPGLRVEEICSNSLFFRVVIAPRLSEDGRNVGYFGAARLELLRGAIMTGNLARTDLTAWQATTVLVGPPGDEINAIMNVMNGFIEGFAAAYHTAGNP